MDEHRIVRVHNLYRHNQRFFRCFECACGWTTTPSLRAAARLEFDEHCFPVLTLDELIDKYATPPYPTPLADLMDRYGIGEDSP